VPLRLDADEKIAGKQRQRRLDLATAHDAALAAARQVSREAFEREAMQQAGRRL
jgi:hypothetical protein